jgi:CRISPR/Cas system-associated exonuclease Cas4 (RecB family)
MPIHLIDQSLCDRQSAVQCNFTFPFHLDKHKWMILNPSILISPSSISIASQCIMDALWKEECIVAQETSIEMITGIIIHQMMQKYLVSSSRKNVCADKNSSLKTILETIMESCIAEQENLPSHIRPEQLERCVRDQLDGIVKSLTRVEEEYEEFTSEDMMLDPILGFKGYIDVCATDKNTQKRISIEIKTGKNRDIHHVMQILLYTFMLKTKYQNTDDKGIFMQIFICM